MQEDLEKDKRKQIKLQLILDKLKAKTEKHEKKTLKTQQAKYEASLALLALLEEQHGNK